MADPPTLDAGLVGGASLSPNTANEDAVAAVRNCGPALRAIAVADGVGSASHASEASQFLVNRFRQLVTAATAPPSLDAVFRQMHQDLDAHSRLILEPNADTGNTLASTLVAALEYDTHFDLAYLGNGAIWHIRGNFGHFRDTQYLPWSAINLLNPHTNQDRNGRESLYKSFATGAAQADTDPSLLRLSKDDRYGDIIVVCTDGIYSFDQVRMGRVAADNSIWISGEPLMVRFFSCLKTFLAQQEPTDEGLCNALQQYLSAARDARLLDDDASIAVIVSSSAIRSRQRIAKIALSA